MKEVMSTMGKSNSGSKFRGLVCLCLLAGLMGATAQNFTVDRAVIAGGGGTSTNSQYSLSGTVAQVAPGKSSGGTYSLDAGFWSVVVAVQSADMPFLTITRAGSNLIITWPASSDPGLALEFTSSLAHTINWQNTGATPTSDGTTRTVTVPLTPGFLFFRLHKP